MSDMDKYNYSMKYAKLGVSIGMPLGIVLLCVGYFLFSWKFSFFHLGTLRYGLKGFMIIPVIGAIIGGIVFGLIGLIIDSILDKLKGK